MPHPSAYDSAIDDRHRPLDESWETLTPAQMCELMAKLRDQLVAVHLAAEREKSATAPAPSPSPT